MHGDFEVVDGGVVEPRLESHAAGWQVGRHMQAEHAHRAVQRARRDKGLCALPDFLSGLKDEAHLTAKFLPLRREQLRRAEQARDMRVMPAGVHHARRFRSICRAACLLDRQRVDVCPQDDRAAVSCATQRTQYARFADAHVRDLQLIQFLLDALGRPVLLQAQLGAAVKFPPQSDERAARFGADLWDYRHGQCLLFRLRGLPHLRVGPIGAARGGLSPQTAG